MNLRVIGASSTAPAVATAGRGLAAVLVLCFALVLLYAAAFAPAAALHDAAHDSRHGLSFPCH